PPFVAGLRRTLDGGFVRRATWLGTIWPRLVSSPSQHMARVVVVAVEDSFIFIAAVISRLEMGHGTFVGCVVIKKRKTWSLMAKMMFFPQTTPDDGVSEKAVFVGWLCVVSHHALPKEGLSVARKGGEGNRE
ncbi:hypothetical protein ACLOJK_034488, partial [Asimina triloba]